MNTIRLTNRSGFVYSLTVGLLMLWSWNASAAIQYSTPMESVTWQTEASKFLCRLSHRISGFGEAVFQREAGKQTEFYLNSHTPRMKTGTASLISRAPAWSAQASVNKLASINVLESMVPINVGRQLSERMLAELEKGMLLDFNRAPWYGDTEAITVTISSIGFRRHHQDYLQCLSGLLPVNYAQVEKSSLYYGNDDKALSAKVKQRLDKVIRYALEDPKVKVFYLDGHTDSEGIRNENLIKSKVRTERIVNYLVKNGIKKEQIVSRWHGERYPIASNRTAAGRAKNRRVTLRLSKDPMPKLEAPKEIKEDQAMERMEPGANVEDANASPPATN